MDRITAKQAFEPIRKVYSNLDYFKFCELLGLDPQYDIEYWSAFQDLCRGLAKFSDTSLQKILDYDGSKVEATNGR